MTYNTKTFGDLEGYCRRLLIWPKLGPLCLLPIATFSVLWILNLTHLILSLGGSLALMVLEDLFCQIVSLSTLYLEVMFLVNFKEFVKLLHKLDDGIVEDTAKIDCNLATFLNFMFCIWLFAIPCELLFSYYDSRRCKRYGSVEVSCPVMMALWLPSDHHLVAFAFDLLTVGVVLQKFMTYFVLCSYEVFCSEMIVLRIERLKSLLEAIDFAKEVGARRQFRNCVSLHTQIIGLHRDFVSCSSKVMVPLNFSYSVTVSLSAVLFYVNPTHREVAVIMAWTVTMLYQQHIAQRLIDSSSSLTQVLYNSNWYRAELPRQREVVIFMAATQRPLQIRLSGLGTMSHESICEMFTRLFKYLTVFWNVYLSFK